VAPARWHPRLARDSRTGLASERSPGCGTITHGGGDRPVPNTDRLFHTQAAVGIVVLLLLWLLETWFPFFIDRPQRLRHDLRNLVVGGLNLTVIGLGFSAATASVAAWAERTQFGLLNRWAGPPWVELPVALLLFDAWMYLWHRANHAVPFLWRFHRMHHSDPAVDMTTALRFHFGEIAISSTVRLAVIPLLGLHLWEVILYETILLPVIAFHHSNVALPEAWDHWLRTVIVSPNMHRIHHSDWQPETDSNFASIFSWWDRLGRTFRQREDLRALHFGLSEFDSDTWQSVWGLLRTPLARTKGMTGRPGRRISEVAPGQRRTDERGDTSPDITKER
jgi:sterol desaturase/sphingolipid hydroxylase (fatty acid hydroxylase superfamily)